MTIRVPNLRLRLAEVDDAPRRLRRLAAEALGTEPERISTLRVARRSLDARGRGEPYFAVSVDLTLDDDPRPTAAPPEHPPWRAGRVVRGAPSPVIVGAGPAGMFSALALLEAGIRPLILERGREVEKRKLDVARLYREGALDRDSNVSFGEGGAGTFTDGKLSTNNKSPESRQVLRLLVELGRADSDILVSNRPHLGSERLPAIVARLREKLVEAGCVIRFESRVEGLIVRNGEVAGLRLAGGDTIETGAVILAPGNASRELFADLSSLPGVMTPKPMAVGFRVEHPQALIDRIQYKGAAGHPHLPPAEYSLTARAMGRGAWTFCMCPGGVVVPTPTEEGGLCVNGMSSSRRAGRFANSAVVVEIGPQDYAATGHGESLLSGIDFQQRVERAAFDAGGGRFAAPAQRLTDFLANRVGDLPRTSSYPRGLVPYDLRALYPPLLTRSLHEGIRSLGGRMPGFITEDAVLIGVETRTSGPLSFPRKESGESTMLPGLFPCGEGCGHGGGIVSAAADGLRVGRLIGALLNPPR